jgi:hypothetical protein
MIFRPNRARLRWRLALAASLAVTLLSADAPVTGARRTETATLTITEVSLRTYRITLDDQAMTLGVVPEETTVTCDGRERPLPGAIKPGMTALCLRTYPTTIRIRLKDNGAPAGEQDFHTSDGGASLRYVITKAGHDTAFRLERQ